ncbi:unnamed protein product, partial [Allacma fusca]
VLGNDNLQVNSELDVFKAVVSWGMHTLTKLGKRNQGILPNDDEADTGIKSSPVQPPGLLSDKRAGSVEAPAETPRKFANSES